MMKKVWSILLVAALVFSLAAALDFTASAAEAPLYLMRSGKNGNAYSLCTDEEGTLYPGKGTDWKLTRDTSDNTLILDMKGGSIDRDIQARWANAGEVVTLAVVFYKDDLTIGGLDTAGAKLTVMKQSGQTFSRFTINGDVSASNVYFTGCQGVAVTVNGSVTGTGNMIVEKAPLTVHNGSLHFESGYINIHDATVKIEADETVAYGMRAQHILAENSALTIDGTDDGIQLVAVAAGSDGGASITLQNASNLTVNAKNVGIHGTKGENYYNNINMSDADSSIKIQGGTKAVFCADFVTVPEGLTARSTDPEGRLVQSAVNEDFTVDIYHAGTTQPAKCVLLDNHPANVYNAVSAVREGVHTLVLNHHSVGEYTIAAKKGGFTLKNEAGYLALNAWNHMLTYVDDAEKATVWHDDGGLYANLPCGGRHRAGWFRAARTVRYYLAPDCGGKLSARLVYTPAEVMYEVEGDTLPVSLTAEKTVIYMGTPVRSFRIAAGNLPAGAKAEYLVGRRFVESSVFTMQYKPAVVLVRVTEPDHTVSLWRATLVDGVYVVTRVK